MNDYKLTVIICFCISLVQNLKFDIVGTFFVYCCLFYTFEGAGNFKKRKFSDEMKAYTSTLGLLPYLLTRLLICPHNALAYKPQG